MPGFNQLVLVGNLTRDPDVRYTPNGKAVAKFGLAVNRKVGQQERTVFVDVTTWEKLAEICQKYLRKGACVLLSGELAMDEWEDKSTGQKRSKLYMNAREMQMLDGRGESAGDDSRRDNGGQTNRSRPEAADPPRREWATDDGESPETPTAKDDIPF